MNINITGLIYSNYPITLLVNLKYKIRTKTLIESIISRYYKDTDNLSFLQCTNVAKVSPLTYNIKQLNNGDILTYSGKQIQVYSLKNNLNASKQITCYSEPLNLFNLSSNKLIVILPNSIQIFNTTTYNLINEKLLTLSTIKSSAYLNNQSIALGFTSNRIRVYDTDLTLISEFLAGEYTSNLIFLDYCLVACSNIMMRSFIVEDGEYICTQTINNISPSKLVRLRKRLLAVLSDMYYEVSLYYCKGKLIAIGNLVGHTGPVTHIHMLKDSNLVTGALDKTLRIWNRKKLNCINVIKTESVINSMYMTRDGRIVGCFRDSNLRIWNPKSDYKLESELRGHSLQILCAIQLSEGVIASVSADKTMRIWN
jgi:WD40 repeat protein